MGLKVLVAADVCPSVRPLSCLEGTVIYLMDGWMDGWVDGFNSHVNCGKVLHNDTPTSLVLEIMFSDYYCVSAVSPAFSTILCVSLCRSLESRG